jgi:rubredoxin
MSGPVHIKFNCPDCGFCYDSDEYCAVEGGVVVEQLGTIHTCPDCLVEKEWEAFTPDQGAWVCPCCGW